MRALGRAIGEPLLGPVFVGIGAGLTMYPEFRENLVEGAPPAEFMADATIDGIGFGVGELAGWLAGLAAVPEANVFSLGVKVGADVVVGAVHDAAVDGLGARDWLTGQLQAQASHSALASFVDPQARPGPIPTAPTGTPKPTSTPSPSAPVSPPLSGREEVSQPGAVPIEPIVTQTPPPPDSDRYGAGSSGHHERNGCVRLMMAPGGRPGTTKAAAEARLLYSVPLEPLERLKRYALVSAVSCWIVFMLFGILLSTSDWGSPAYWAAGWACVVSSTIAGLSLPWWAPHTRRARAFYAASALVRVPMFLMYVVAGAALLAAILPPISAGWVFAGFIAGLALLPLAVAQRRRSLRQSVEEGHLRQSYDRAEARWDPRFDMDHILRDPRRMRPGFWWRMAFWLGPAVGLSLADVIGRISALLVAGLLGIAVGYGSLMAIGSESVAIVLELRRLEADLGKPIHLAS